jgi:hypothetical protein
MFEEIAQRVGGYLVAVVSRDNQSAVTFVKLYPDPQDNSKEIAVYVTITLDALLLFDENIELIATAVLKAFEEKARAN